MLPETQTKPEKQYIYINEDWRITHDPYNLILQKRKISKDKEGNEKETWSNSGFYSTYKEIMHALIEKKVNEANTLSDIVKQIEELHQIVTGGKYD